MPISILLCCRQILWPQLRQGPLYETQNCWAIQAIRVGHLCMPSLGPSDKRRHKRCQPPYNHGWTVLQSSKATPLVIAADVFVITIPLSSLAFLFIVLRLRNLEATGIIFRYLSEGPEVLGKLGYASTMIRGSRFMRVLAETGSMKFISILWIMGDQRIRYGFSSSTFEGYTLMGVGYEYETESTRKS